MAEPRPTVALSLPDVGPGPDHCSLSALAAEQGFVVASLRRDHLCTNCRKQGQSVAEQDERFRERAAEVVVVNARDDEPRVAPGDSGRSTFDRPPVGDVSATLDDRREGQPS